MCNTGNFSGFGESTQDATDENTDQIGQVPWMVSIGILDGERFEHQCGGSLVTPLHVLTAAHCFNNFRISSLPEG